MFSRITNATTHLQLLANPKLYFISKFCLILCIILQRVLLIVQDEPEDYSWKIIVQLIALFSLIICEYLLSWAFSKRKFRKEVQAFVFLIIQIGFSQLFLELSLLGFSRDNRVLTEVFFQDTAWLNILTVILTDSSLLKGGLLFYILSISALELSVFANKLYYLSWALSALVIIVATFLSGRIQCTKDPLKMNNNHAKFSNLETSIEGVCIIDKNKDITYMNGLFKGLFEASTDKEALAKILKLRKFDSYSQTTQRGYLQEIKPKNISTRREPKEPKSPTNFSVRSIIDHHISLDVPKNNSLAQIRGSFSPRPSIFANQVVNHRSSLFQGTPSILLKGGSNFNFSSKNLDTATNTATNINAYLPRIKINLSRIHDEDSRPGWFGNEVEARSPLIHLSPEPSFLGESFAQHFGQNRMPSPIGNPFGTGSVDTSNPFPHDPVIMGLDAAEKHVDSVESIIDQIFTAMIKNTDKKHYAMAQLVDHLPFSMDIFNDRNPGSPTNRQESTTMGASLERFNIVAQDSKKGIRIYEVSLSAFIYQQKETVCICVRDVSYEVKVEDMNEALEAKNKILKFVSHEFRTPLNCAISLLDVVKKHVTPEVWLKYLSPALNSSKMLLSLVNDILDHAQIQARKFKINITPCKIKRVLQEVIEMMDIQAQAKRVELRLDWDSRIPKRFYTDPNRLRQIMLNLVSNSLKYTTKGHIILQGKYENATTCKIAVIDTGVGISKESLRTLFQEFGKLNENSHLNPQGVGLGLVISKLLSQELGPDSEGLLVESEEGRGSVFHFSLESKIDAFGEIEDIIERESLEENGSAPMLNRTTYIGWDDVSPRMHSLKHKVEQKMSPKSVSKIAKKLTLSPQAMSKNHLPLHLSDIPHSMTAENLETITLSSQKKPAEEGHKKNLVPSFRDVNGRPNSIHRSYTLEDLRRVQTLKSDAEFNTFLRKCQHNCKKPMVLLVDDSMFNLTALQALLSNAFGIDSKVAMNGELAIQEVLNNEQACSKCNNFKVIFMDVEMPDMNGFETTQILRKKMLDGEISFIPIIGVTGHNPNDKRVQCLISGMNDMVAKPVSPQIIKELFIKWIHA